MMIVSLISAGAAAISAYCWVRAANIATPLPMAYLSGPPKDVEDAISNQSKWNGRAAWAASLTAVTQAIVAGEPVMKAWMN